MLRHYVHEYKCRTCGSEGCLAPWGRAEEKINGEERGWERPGPQDSAPA